MGTGGEIISFLERGAYEKEVCHGWITALGEKNVFVGVKIVKTEGGFIVFESVDDYKVWKKRGDV